MNSKHQKILLAAVLKLLRPLARILLRNGISYGTFSDIAKWVYVDVAANEFGIEGRKQSTSRVSVITGLSRKEVSRLQNTAKPDDRTGGEKYNRAARVIAAWRREQEFLDKNGNPADLSMAGPWATFSELVRRFSGDVPARAILDELIHVGVVEKLKNGKIRLLAKAYIPKNSEADKLHILGSDVAQLISTIDYNLKTDSDDSRFQRKVAYDNLPDDVLPEFRLLSSKKAQMLLEKLDQWLAQHDRDTTPTTEGSGRNFAGLGIYYFEQPYSNEDE
jgi:hypothetical protein